MSDSANTGNNDNARANRTAKGDGLERRVPKVVSVPEVSPVAGEPAGGEGVSGLGSMPDSARAQGVASNRASAQAPNQVSASTPTPSAASTGAAHVIPLPSLEERAASASAAPANGASVGNASPAKSAAAGVAVDAVANGVAAGGVGAAPAAAAAPTTPAGAASAAAPTAAGANASAGEQSAAFASAGQSAPRPSVKDQAKGKPRLRNKKSAAKNAAGAEGASAQGDSSASEAEGANAAKAKRPSLAHLSQTDIKKTLATIGAVLAVVIAVALFVSWGRWWRYNDAADFQGQWFSQGTEGTAVVTIDDTAIHLSGEVAYSYAIDPTAKTISYDFGTMHGQGRYWFSDDRNTLVIIDGADYTATSTFFEDIGIWLQGVLARIQGKGAVLPASDNAVYLVKYNPSTISAGSSQSNAGMAAGADNDTEASSVSSAAASGQTDTADAASTGADAAASPSAGAISDTAQPVVTGDSAPADSPADAGAAADDAVAAPAEGSMDEAFGVTPGSGGE